MRRDHKPLPVCFCQSECIAPNGNLQGCSLWLDRQREVSPGNSGRIVNAEVGIDRCEGHGVIVTKERLVDLFERDCSIHRGGREGPCSKDWRVA